MSKPVAPDVDHGTISKVEELATDSALLVVKRGPNAGFRFVLDRPSMSTGRPTSSSADGDVIQIGNFPSGVFN